MAYVVSPGPAPALPVDGTSDVFPVHRIFCVGRNYADHARQMGGDPEREPPFFFMKPPSALLPEGGNFPYPPLSEDVHHEIELVVAIGQGGGHIRAEDALHHVYGYAVGLDMTRRDLQAEAKKMARPWEASKGFDFSAPCSRIGPAMRIGHPANGSIWLDVNGKRVQDSDISAMIWNVSEVVAALSRLFTLEPGDLVFTGTPGGQGAVRRGDVLHGGIDKIGELAIRVV